MKQKEQTTYVLSLARDFPEMLHCQSYNMIASVIIDLDWALQEAYKIINKQSEMLTRRNEDEKVYG